MITKSTTPTLTTTIAMFTCEEILMPAQMTAVSSRTMVAATRLCPSPYAQSGIVMPAEDMTSAK